MLVVRVSIPLGVRPVGVRAARSQGRPVGRTRIPRGAHTPGDMDTWTVGLSTCQTSPSSKAAERLP